MQNHAINYFSLCLRVFVVITLFWFSLCARRVYAVNYLIGRAKGSRAKSMQIRKVIEKLPANSGPLYAAPVATPQGDVGIFR